MLSMLWLWISNRLRWVRLRVVCFFRWLVGALATFVIWLGGILPPMMQGLLVAYIIWAVITLGIALFLGWLLKIWLMAIIFWVAFAILLPFVLIPWGARAVVLALLSIAVIGIVISMSGVAPVYISAFAILIIAVTVLRYLPVPLWVRTLMAALLIAGLVVVITTGALDRTLIGGRQLFNPQTGAAIAKINPETGEIFEGSRARYSYDPRTGDELRVLTSEELKKLRKRRLRFFQSIQLPQLSTGPISVTVPPLPRMQAPPTVSQPTEWTYSLSVSKSFIVPEEAAPTTKGTVRFVCADEPYYVILPDFSKVQRSKGCTKFENRVEGGTLQLLGSRDGQEIVVKVR